MKIWVDDVREAPKGWIWCKAVDDAKYWIIDNLLHITDISLDHDAGEYRIGGGDYVKILDWMELLQNDGVEGQKFDFHNITFHIHSMNPVGVQNMRAIIKRNAWKEETEFE